MLFAICLICFTAGCAFPTGSDVYVDKNGTVYVDQGSFVRHGGSADFPLLIDESIVTVNSDIQGSREETSETTAIQK